jgi:hypothetical protein
VGCKTSPSSNWLSSSIPIAGSPSVAGGAIEAVATRLPSWLLEAGHVTGIECERFFMIQIFRFSSAAPGRM